MKLKCLSMTIMICLLILISGCRKEEISGNIVENISEAQDADSVVVIGSGEAKARESDSAQEVEQNDNVVIIEYDEETGTNADLVKELMKDLVDEDAAAEEEVIEEETAGAGGKQEIIIDNFRGDPKDLAIEAGTTVIWTNNMHFNHVIIILPAQGDGTYAKTGINDLQQIWFEESYSFTFNETGKYKWGSKTKFDTTNGIITVV